MTRLIGRRCKRSDVFSRPVLIGRRLGDHTPLVLAMECSRSATSRSWKIEEQGFPVTIAVGPHPSPSRTRKLSPPAPMVLGGQPPGRVGRRRDIRTEPVPWRGTGFFASGAASVTRMASGFGGGTPRRPRGAAEGRARQSPSGRAGRAQGARSGNGESRTRGGSLASAGSGAGGQRARPGPARSSRAPHEGEGSWGEGQARRTGADRDRRSAGPARGMADRDRRSADGGRGRGREPWSEAPRGTGRDTTRGPGHERWSETTRGTGRRPPPPKGAWGTGDDRPRRPPVRTGARRDQVGRGTVPGPSGGSTARGGASRMARPRPSQREERPVPSGWGSVTRRGAREVERSGFPPPASRLRQETPRVSGAAPAVPSGVEAGPVPVRPPVPREVLRVARRPVLAEGARRGAPPEERRGAAPAWKRPAIGPAEKRRPARAQLAGPKDKGRTRARGVADELPRLIAARLGEAAEAYAADRYQDALRLLRNLVLRSPGSASVRELLGLTYYRLGRWRLAIRELLVHHEISGSYDQYPVIADCYRALHRYDDVEAVWLELREASPSGEVVAEGRLVAAGALADRGDFGGAFRLLEPSLRRTKPRQHDLRQWYALADLYEQAGELPRARDLFARVASADPGAYDVSQRLAALA